MKVKCPRCTTLVQWDGNEWRPFCSKRCKLLDLGAWASEEYRVSEDPASDDDINHLVEMDAEK